MTVLLRDAIKNKSVQTLKVSCNYSWRAICQYCPGTNSIIATKTGPFTLSDIVVPKLVLQWSLELKNSSLNIKSQFG